MFMFRASQVVKELERFVPDILAACRNAIDEGRADLDFFRLTKTAFACLPQRFHRLCRDGKNRQRCHAAPGGRVERSEDRGKPSGRLAEKDDLDNVVKGDVVLHDVGDSYLHAEHRLVAAVGLKDHIVVETSDAVMISPRDRVQDVKGLVDQLKSQNRRRHGRISGSTGRGAP